MCYATITSRMNLGQEKRFRLCVVLTQFPWYNPLPSPVFLFLLHLNCSTVKDAHFLTKSNDVSLIHFILIFLLPLAPLPNDLLDFSLSNFKFHILMLLPFHSYLFCPSSSLLCWIQVFPLILDSHQISVCFICIFIMWTQFGPKETSRSQKIYRNQSSVNQIRAGTRIHQCCQHAPVTILPGTLVSKSFIYWLE